MGLDIDLYTPKIDIDDDGADDIVIEITGLKSISKFIGLEDTPLYYDNGKFFKVEDNKIIYTDIEWKDISGNLEDAPEIVALIKELVEEISTEIVDNHIYLHNIAENAHPYIQNIIHENYVTLDTKIDDTKEELSQDISNLNDALNQEISDRETADNALSEDIQEETLARIETDTTLQNNIDTLTNNLNTEIENRTNADVTLQNNIDAEVLARQNADTVLQNNINTLSQTVTDNNTAINNRVDSVVSAFDDEIETINTNLSNLSDTVSNNYTDLDSKISDLTTTVNNNDTAINNKVDGINTTLTNSINNLSDTVSSNYTILDTKIDNTKTSLEGDISDLSTTVLNNYTTLDGKITNLTSTVNDNYTELDGRITTNTNNISTIDSKIPNQASSSNQLADKDFVNSSIATNTATFRGTYNSVAELEVYAGEKDNNDYAFVTGVDSLGNTYYDNYVYNGTAWVYRYRLNNSSFTAAQWTSINSGATTENINQITTNTNNITNLQTNKQDVLTAGENIQINNNVISATDTTYTAGTGISIVNGVISNTQTSAEWGNIQGTLSNQSDLQSALNAKYDASNPNGYISSASISSLTDVNLTNVANNQALLYNFTTQKWENKDVTITVDSALDNTSMNPVENRVIAQALEEISLAKNPNLNLIGGNLNIDNGNVSNFSTTDYMQFPFVFNFNGCTWTLEMGFTTGSDVTTQQNILDSYYGVAFAINNGKFLIALSSNGSLWDIGSISGTYSVQANTAYSVKISWDGNNYTLSYALDETNYTTDISIASTETHHSTQEYVGGEPELFGSGSQHPFTGTINLNKWKLIVNGLEVWLGMDDVGLGSRANIDLSNLTEAGLAKFQAPLISGINIKTINNESILGNGNIEIQAGGTVEEHYDPNSTNAQAGTAVAEAVEDTQTWVQNQNYVNASTLENYQAKLTEGANISIEEIVPEWSTPVQNLPFYANFDARIVYGNGKFVYIGYDDNSWEEKVSTSTDGITWTTPEVLHINMYDMAFGNGKFVIVNSNSEFSYSTDGITWSTPVQVFDDTSCETIVFGNGKFVALGKSGGYVSTSTDGITWTTPTQDTNLASMYCYYSLYACGYYIACDAYDNLVSSSIDGLTWTTPIWQGIFEFRNSVAYGNTEILSINNGYYELWTFDPTTGFTKKSTITDSNLDNYSWTDICSDDKGYTAINSESQYMTQLPNKGTIISCVDVVKSVNNVTPDTNGNVTISIPDVSDFVTETELSTTLEDYVLSTDISDMATQTWVQNQGYISTLPTNLVTTDTAQDISGRKTFLGEKAIYFKQLTTANKLGFTLYNPNNTELGALEYRPNTIGSASLLALNCPQTTGGYVGFRYWGTSAVNIVAPKVATAGNYYIPINFTDGTNTVTSNNVGTVNISTLLPDVSGFATQTWVQNQNYLTSSALTDYVTNSSLAITLQDYATKNYVDTGLATKQATLVSGTNIKTINNNSILGSGNLTLDGLPSQTGQSGKFLTTDGTDASWATISIPTVDQTYDSTSMNAQSGVAIASELNSYVLSSDIEAYTATEIETLWGSI